MKLLLLCIIIIQIFTVLCTKEKEIKRRRKAYVALHNELRSKLAHGKSKDNGGSKMPKGQNIYKLEANTSLESTAQEWANGCLYEHSPKDQRNNAGQNIFQRCSTNSSQLEDLDNELTRGILKWWGELEEFGYNRDLLILGSDNQTGHWTQMAWANSTSVGCGLSNCQVKSDQCVYVVCNYFPPGNFKSELIYQKGKPCRKDSECTTYKPSKCDRKLGLCRRIAKDDEKEKKARTKVNKKENKSHTKEPSQVENENKYIL
ncbi:cysteine-rich secretory protein family domain-containing protein [Ditylenchus destructor]|uniref:Cysteine-rich secretory protein family domain-containing protein n=1 Tax=Ditylenchus destructor TaxID=166010 RepID=A0AAD4MSQ0_9BILA|nr:cysteine-rich secretory protein family domain-containing protein [Ditylenchus destructor]